MGEQQTFGVEATQTAVSKSPLSCSLSETKRFVHPVQVNLEDQQGIRVGKDPGAEFVCQIRLPE